MWGITNYYVFIVAAILLNITPGADTMYIIGRSVSQGVKAGVYSALGIASGTVVHTLLAAFGLSLILTKSVVLFTVIKLIGVVYLLYLGISMLRSKATDLADTYSAQPISLRKIFLQGMLTNVMNPKVALFFLAFLPQFIDTNAQSPVPFVILGLTFITTGTIWNLIIAYFSSFATKKLRENPKVGVLLNRITGVVFIGMGLNLFRAKLN